MQFKKFTAGRWAYGRDSLPVVPQEDNVCFDDPALEEVLREMGNSEQKEALVRVIIFLACCHTIIIDHKKGRYNSSSPDELALVNAAKQFGFEFKDRDENDNIIILDKANNREYKYQLLNICEFTSTRKRQSCIMRDPKGKIILMCKGADTVITERLTSASRNSQVFSATQKFVDEFAESGLRTLFLAEKYLDEQTYAQWNEESKIAKLSINNREEKVAAVDEKIEVGLELVGSTAIEDKLQDQVAETIQFMKTTGIKVWVLTGDKVETAMNIGVSAGLLDKDMDTHIIEDTEHQKLK
jgi:magnesium-transporting ATPase (P-type)